MTERISGFAFLVLGSLAPVASAQSPTIKQLMLDLIHPASNDILLAVYRGSPADDKEWTAVRRNALTLAGSGSLLMARNQSVDWTKAARLLSDAGADAYQAAVAKDAKALAAVTARLDASCTTCHKQFRPNVFPPEGGSK